MQLRSVRQARRLLLLLLFNFILSSTYSLKCRSEDGPSDAELKRVARTCMHKISENSYSSKRSNSGSTSGSGQTLAGAHTNSYYGQQSHQYDQHGQNSNGKNYYSYDDDMQREESSGNNYRGNSNNNNNYDRVYSNDNLKHRNRERTQNNHGTRSQRSASVLFNFERSSNGNGRYDQSSNSGRNSNGGGGNSYGAGSNNGGSSSRDHRSSASTSSSSNNNNYNSSSHDRDRQSQESACVVHCFFEEMNMLNKDDFPDKHKVSYLLTKDMRDRELRSFYTETIQECFHYLDSQRRRDKCHFSRDLIHCMTEYAKANCDDWDDYNIMFN